MQQSGVPVSRPRRLHLGCGADVLDGWTNHDLAMLPGVDVVHDLDVFPWPFETASYDVVKMQHVLEHLEHPIPAIEELHRITKQRGRVFVRVPYWNSQDFASDPTHRTRFNEYTFDYFDPSTRHGRERAYYANARFAIRSKTYWMKPALVYVPVRMQFAQRLLSGAARHLAGVIWVVEWELEPLEART